MTSRQVSRYYNTAGVGYPDYGTPGYRNIMRRIKRLGSKRRLRRRRSARANPFVTGEVRQKLLSKVIAAHNAFSVFATDMEDAYERIRDGKKAGISLPMIARLCDNQAKSLFEAIRFLESVQ